MIDISTFQEIIESYGKENVDLAVNLIDTYIDDWYLKVTNKEHKYVSTIGRMLFAEKLLECLAETCVEFRHIHNSLVDIINNEPARGIDPLIYYATSPGVLGYWLLKQEDINYDSISGTAYEFGESIY